MKGKLSPFWGYEFIGADLVLPLLNSRPKRFVKIATDESVYLKDIPKRSLGPDLLKKRKTEKFQYGRFHGTMVANIILGDPPIGLTNRAKLTMANLKTEGPKSTRKLLQAGIEVLQSSQSIYSKKFLKSLPKEFISIRSAGNTFPHNRLEQVLLSRSIMVSQLSPFGGTSYDSTSHKNISVSAPGRVYSRYKGKIIRFAGTSGAQPVTSGCAINIVSLLPGLKKSELTYLINKTLIPTLNSTQTPSMNGRGTINCFKLVKVALRLANSWPYNRDYISNRPSLYLFSKETSELKQKLIHAKGKKKITLLRKIFLLNPRDRLITARLMTSLRKSKYPANSYLYQSILGFSKHQLQLLIKKWKDLSYFGNDLIRLIGDYYPQYQKMIIPFLQSNNTSTILLSSHYLPERKFRFLVLKALLRIFTLAKISAMESIDFVDFYTKSKFKVKNLLTICEKIHIPKQAGKPYKTAPQICRSLLPHNIPASLQLFRRLAKKKSFDFFDNYYYRMTKGRTIKKNSVRARLLKQMAQEKWLTKKRRQNLLAIIKGNGL